MAQPNETDLAARIKLLSGTGEPIAGSFPLPGSRVPDLVEMRNARSYIETWPHEPVSIRKYNQGEYADPETGQVLYSYPEGEILLINGSQVMGTCERPWAERNVKAAISELSGFRTNPQSEHLPLFTVLGGFGLGMEADEWINHMHSGGINNTPKGGELLVFELNIKNAAYGKERLGKKVRTIESDVHRSRGLAIPLTTDVIQTDILTGLQDLREQITSGERRQADAISLDLFDPHQTMGTTDLLYMDLVGDCLAPDGVFTFFPYDKSTGAGINPVQQAILEHYGFEYRTNRVNISPPPQYKYLFIEDHNGRERSVRELMVVTAHKKRGWKPLVEA